MILIVMGVAGSGKTTVGKILAEKLLCRFYDGDDFHPPANILKMTEGIPLTEEDRVPWLDALQKLLKDAAKHNDSLVLACSALRETFRQHLVEAAPQTQFAFLTGPSEELAKRLDQRKGHYMKSSMLQSQLALLEVPQNPLVTVDIRKESEVQVEEILKAISSDKL